MRHALLLIALAGCDKLFGLQPIDVSGDATGGDDDGDVITPVDAPGDVPAICAAPSGHDEDGDAIDDACDLCPTVANTDNSDADGDGLPDACDPNLGVGGADKILFYTGFATAADLSTNFTATGTSQNGGGGGIVAITAGVLTSKTMFVPTKVELRTSGLAGTTGNDEAVIAAPNASCQVRHSSCSSTTDTTKTCALVGGNSSGAQLGSPSGGVTAISLAPLGSAIACSISNGGATVSAQANVVFTLGSLSVSASMGATLTIKSIVIYGSGP